MNASDLELEGAGFAQTEVVFVRGGTIDYERDDCVDVDDYS